jgi:hypothetical protein
MRPRLEGIALIDIAAFDSALEPGHALRRGAVGERVGNGVATRLLLQAVVADGAGSVQPFLDVACLDDVARAIGVVGPDPGQAIGLELKAHRQGVGLGLAGTAARRFHLVQDAKQVLHVVTNLVRDDVRLGKIAGRLIASL